MSNINISICWKVSSPQNDWPKQNKTKKTVRGKRCIEKYCTGPCVSHGLAKEVWLNRNICDFWHRNGNDFWSMIRMVKTHEFSAWIIPWNLTTIQQIATDCNSKRPFLLHCFIGLRVWTLLLCSLLNGLIKKNGPGLSFHHNLSQRKLWLWAS